MKVFLLFVCFFAFLMGDEVDVDIKADKFSADKSKNTILFTGNVSMLKGEDKLFCEKLLVTTKINPKDGKTVVHKYHATGKVSMSIKRPTTVMKGRGNEVTYNVDDQVYVIIGNGYLEDTVGEKIVKGERIYLDEKTGNTKIDGSENKPVQFKFKMENKDANENN